MSDPRWDEATEREFTVRLANTMAVHGFAHDGYGVKEDLEESLARLALLWLADAGLLRTPQEAEVIAAATNRRRHQRAEKLHYDDIDEHLLWHAELNRLAEELNRTVDALDAAAPDREESDG